MSNYDVTKAANIAVDKLFGVPEGTSHYILTEAMNIIADNINVGGGAPNPDPLTLADGEMLRFDDATGEMEGSGDINTDDEVNFGTKTVVSGTGTFRLGQAHDMSSSGENITFTNLVDNEHFNPIWIPQGETEGKLRVTPGSFIEFTQESSKADVLINPSWTSNPLVDWRVTQMTFEAETTITNVILNITRDGKDFYRAKLGTLNADVETLIDLENTIDNVPVDAFALGVYVVSVSSPDGNVRLKGSIANSLPFFKVGYYEFEDLAVNEFTVDEKNKLASLTGGRFLGVFADLTALQTAHPTGVSGDHAVVTDPNSNIFYWGGSSWVDSGVEEGGDMFKAVYDPANKNSSAFSMDNMDETITKKILTSAERAEIAANTLKATNATHTGEVTGNGVLTVNTTAISNKSLITGVSGMELLVNDGGVLKKVDASDFLGGNDGVKVYYAESLGVSSNGSSSYYTKVTLNLPEGFEAGDYFIEVGYGFRINSTTYDFIGKVLVDYSQIGDLHQEEMKDAGSDQNVPAFRRFKKTFTSGTHTIELDYKPSNDDATAYIKGASITVTKIDIQT